MLQQSDNNPKPMTKICEFSKTNHIDSYKYKRAQILKSSISIKKAISRLMQRAQSTKRKRKHRQTEVKHFITFWKHLS